MFAEEKEDLQIVFYLMEVYNKPLSVT